MGNECLPQMMRIPAGEFLMGSDHGDPDERPIHSVFLDEFHLAATPVTNAEYARFIQATGHKLVTLDELPCVVGPQFRDSFNQIAARFLWKGGCPPEGYEDHPVTLVQYSDAVEYCRWLSSVSGKTFRLPTEAEWEKAARGGLEARRYPWGDNIDPSCANYLPDPSLKARRGTTPVNSYPCNAYRLFDMAGNVWQWVSDWYDPGYYAASEPRNPAGPLAGRLRCVRGGSWVNDDVTFLRCANRHEVPPDTYAYSIGFRVAS